MSSAFLSGKYREWIKSRGIQVPKICRKVRLKGLIQAFGDPKKVSCDLYLNGQMVLDWDRKGDCIVFPVALLRGEYRIEIIIKYSDLERTVYER